MSLFGIKNGNKELLGISRKLGHVHRLGKILGGSQ
jgi:hypothetical protein